MSTKLYVGGLPYSATESQLSTLFAEHGTVESARVIADKFTGQSRGFRLCRNVDCRGSQGGDHGLKRFTDGWTVAHRQ